MTRYRDGYSERSIEDIEAARERRERRLLALPRRREMIDHLRKLWDQIPETEKAEKRIQYLGALMIVEDPRASVAQLREATKMIGELVGLYRQKIDLTAIRDDSELDQTKLIDDLAALPDNMKQAIVERMTNDGQESSE